jgi:hypothetical protein
MCKIRQSDKVELLYCLEQVQVTFLQTDLAASLVCPASNAVGLPGGVLAFVRQAVLQAMDEFRRLPAGDLYLRLTQQF